MKIYVVDKTSQESLGIIRIIPRKDDRIIINRGNKNLECIVSCVVFHEEEHKIFVFVDVVTFYYGELIQGIKWNDEEE